MSHQDLSWIMLTPGFQSGLWAGQRVLGSSAGHRKRPRQENRKSRLEGATHLWQDLHYHQNCDLVKPLLALLLRGKWFQSNRIASYLLCNITFTTRFVIYYVGRHLFYRQIPVLLRTGKICHHGACWTPGNDQDWYSVLRGSKERKPHAVLVPRPYFLGSWLRARLHRASDK